MDTEHKSHNHMVGDNFILVNLIEKDLVSEWVEFEDIILSWLVNILN